MKKYTVPLVTQHGENIAGVMLDNGNTGNIELTWHVEHGEAVGRYCEIPTGATLTKPDHYLFILESGEHIELNLKSVIDSSIDKFVWI